MHFGIFSGPRMHLTTADLARCYAMQIIKLKQILLQKRWQLIFFYFLVAKVVGQAIWLAH